MNIKDISPQTFMQKNHCYTLPTKDLPEYHDNKLAQNMLLLLQFIKHFHEGM